MKFFCAACGYADGADSQPELIARGARFLDPDDLESPGICVECALGIAEDDWELLMNHHARGEVIDLFREIRKKLGKQKESPAKRYNSSRTGDLKLANEAPTS